MLRLLTCCLLAPRSTRYMLNVIRQVGDWRPRQEESQQTREEQSAEQIDAFVEAECLNVVIVRRLAEEAAHLEGLS